MLATFLPLSLHPVILPKTELNARASLEKTCSGCLPYFLLFFLPLTFSLSSPGSSEMLGLAGTKVLGWKNGDFAYLFPLPGTAAPLLSQFSTLLEKIELLRNGAINLRGSRIKHE